MSISFKILPARGLVYIHYSGVIEIAESAEAFGQYMRHPDFQLGQKQLVDLADVTGWAPDYANLIALQAKKADAFFAPGHETLFVYHAPNAASREIAGIVLRSWDSVPAVVPLVIDTEAEALAVLGQPETRFSDLLQSA